MSNNQVVIDLKIPALAKYGGVVRDTVYSIALRAGLSVEDGEDIRLSVGEAFTNAIQYAYDGESYDKFVDVKCITDPDKLEIIITDYGRGFTEDDKPPSNKVGLGVGLTFIESLMDDVKIDSPLGIGTTIRMTKIVHL